MLFVESPYVLSYQTDRISNNYHNILQPNVFATVSHVLTSFIIASKDRTYPTEAPYEAPLLNLTSQISQTGQTSHTSQTIHTSQTSQISQTSRTISFL